MIKELESLKNLHIQVVDKNNTELEVYCSDISEHDLELTEHGPVLKVKADHWRSFVKTDAYKNQELKLDF